MRAELSAYGHGLADKPEIVALNKADALSADEIKQQTDRLKRAAKKSPLVISAVSGQGVAEVLRALLKAIQKARTDSVEENCLRRPPGILERQKPRPPASAYLDKPPAIATLAPCLVCHGHTHRPRNVRLDTLVRLRWLAIFGQFAAILVVHFGLEFDVPLWPCFAVIALSALLNVALRFSFHKTQWLEPDRAAYAPGLRHRRADGAAVI